MDVIHFIFKSLDDIYDMVKSKSFTSMFCDGEIDYCIDQHLNELDIVIKVTGDDNRLVFRACCDLAYYYAYYN